MTIKERFDIPTGGKHMCPLLFLVLFATLLMFNNNAEASRSNELNFETCIDSADYYSSVKRWADAERFTVNALRLKPANKTNWLLWANLAEIRRNLNDADGALTAYDIGLSLQPLSERMLSGRASLLIEEKRMDEAITDLNTLLKNDSTLEWPRMIRAMLLLEMGQRSKAEDDYNILKQQYPTNVQAYNGLAAIHAMDGDTDKAIDLYTQSLNIQPDVDAYFYKIMLQADHGQLQQASETLRQAMKEYPRNGNLFLLRAYLHKLNFQNEAAEIALKLAVEYGADPHLIEKIFPKNRSNKGKK